MLMIFVGPARATTVAALGGVVAEKPLRADCLRPHARAAELTTTPRRHRSSVPTTTSTAQPP